MDGESKESTAFAVTCLKHGLVYLTAGEYSRQLDRPNSYWSCPRYEVDGEDIGVCGRHSTFSDEVYEATMLKENFRTLG